MMFYLVMAIVRTGVTIEDIQRAFASPVISWYRIAPNVWIVSSWGDASTIYEQLESLIKPGGNLFVSKLDVSDRQGWMDKRFWTWMREQSG